MTIYLNRGKLFPNHTPSIRNENCKEKERIKKKEEKNKKRKERKKESKRKRKKEKERFSTCGSFCKDVDTDLRSRLWLCT